MNVVELEPKGQSKANIVKPDRNTCFKMDLRSDNFIELLSADLAFKEAAKQYLLIATIDWDWSIEDDNAGTLALSGVSEELMLNIMLELKKDLEEHLDIRRNDTIFLAYDFLADTEILKDEDGMRYQKVTEYIVPRYVINVAVNKAVLLDGGEF